MQVQLFLEAGIPPAELVELGALAEGYGVQTLWASSFRSEERRVGKECRSRGAPYP